MARFHVTFAAGIRTRPGEIVGATARCNDGFAAIEHARGKRSGLPFCWLLCGANKFAAFFRTRRI